MNSRTVIVLMLLCAGLVVSPLRGFVHICSEVTPANHHVHIHIHDGVLHAHIHHHHGPLHEEHDVCDHSHSDECPSEGRIVLIIPRRTEQQLSTVQQAVGVVSYANDFSEQLPHIARVEFAKNKQSFQSNLLRTIVLQV